jgi:hypothetical protein
MLTTYLKHQTTRAVVPLNLKRGLNQAPDKLIVSLRVD